MRHIPDGVLRRLDDEPLAVPDRVTEHLAGCERCSVRHAAITQDAEHAARLLAAPRLVPDVDLAWARMQRELERSPAEAKAWRPAVGVARRARFPRVSLRTGLAMATAVVVVAGSAAAATLTTIFSPTHVAPVSVNQNEFRAIAALAGLSGDQPLGGFTAPSGSTTLRFGTIAWSSGPAHPAGSAAQAATQAGIPVALVAHLPAGVGAARQFVVQPRVTATVTFNARQGSLAGTSVTLNAGPGVLVKYGGAADPGVPALVTMTMRRPTAASTGASISEIEAFLLRQPGIPPELAAELRLLGNLKLTLPVPVPAGASTHSVQIDGSPGVLLSDASNAAAGVIWEDGQGLLHAVVGILASQDVLDVARQLR